MDVVAWLESRVMRISWLLMGRSALPMMPARRGDQVQDTLCTPQCVKECDKRKSAHGNVPVHATNTAKLEGGHWVHSERRLSLAGPGSKLLLPGEVIQHPANGDGLHAPCSLQVDGVRMSLECGVHCLGRLVRLVTLLHSQTANTDSTINSPLISPTFPPGGWPGRRGRSGR